MLGEVLSVASAFFSAGSAIVSAKSLESVDPLNANVWRTFFAVLSMLPFAFATGEINDIARVDTSGLFIVIIAAILGFGIADTCLYKAITLIGISRSYTISYTYPFFTMFLAVLLLSERFLFRYFLGTAVIFMGVVIIFFGLNNDYGKADLQGFMIALATSILYAFGAILVSVGLKSVSVVIANTIRFPVLFLFLLSISRMRPMKSKIDRKRILLLAVSGILGITLSGITYMFSIKMIGVSRASALGSTSPVWTSIMSILLLKEKMSVRVIISSILVVVGIYFLA